MEGAQSTGKRRARVIAAFALACVAFLWMAAPKSVSSSNLGSNWQCSKTAFVLTTCAPILARMPSAAPALCPPQDGVVWCGINPPKAQRRLSGV